MSRITNTEVSSSTRFVMVGEFHVVEAKDVMFVSDTNEKEELLFLGYVTKESYQRNPDDYRTWVEVVPVKRKVKHILHRKTEQQEA